MAEEKKTHWAKWKCVTCGKVNTTRKMGMNHCKCMGSGVDLSECFNGTRFLDSEPLGHSELNISSLKIVKKQYLDAMMDDAKKDKGMSFLF